MRPATPGTSNTVDRAPAGPRRITLAAPSRAAVAAHFSLCFYPGVRAAKPAALTRGYNSWHRPAVPAPQSSAKCRNSRAREAGDRKGREIPVARFADLFRLLRTFPIPQGGTVGSLLSPASRASGVPFMNEESPFRSTCPPPFQAHLYWERSPLSGPFLDWKMLLRLAGSPLWRSKDRRQPLVYLLDSPRRTACLVMHLAPSDL